MTQLDTSAEEFPALADQYRRELMAHCYRMTGSVYDAEDMVQETYVRAWRAYDGFEGRSQLRTWLSAIAVRVASDYRSRAYRRREQATDEVPDAGAQASQQDDLMDQERRALLDRLMAELKPEQREVVVLYEFAELPMQEVADALGCPLQTAYSRLHAARKVVESEVERAREGGMS